MDLICPSPSFETLEAAHQILSKSFRMFCELLDLRAQRKIRHGQSSAQLNTSLGDQSLTRSLTLPSEGSGNPGVSADEDWAALSAKFRRVAMGYLAQYPVGRMVTIQKIFEPFQRSF